MIPAGHLAALGAVRAVELQLRLANAGLAVTTPTRDGRRRQAPPTGGDPDSDLAAIHDGDHVVLTDADPEDVDVDDGGELDLPDDQRLESDEPVDLGDMA